MLAESPWATTVVLRGLQANASATPDNTGYRGEMEENPQITYTLQFRSASPIREAQVRASPLGSHYDKMSAAQKTTFDANSSKFLTVNFSAHVVVSATFESNFGNYKSFVM